MTLDAQSDVTQLLVAWGKGDPEAMEELYPLVHQELLRIAHGRMRHERDQHTLQTTALVHEAFLRLIDQERVGWESRGHFYALATQMMRRVLVDYARRRRGQKRGGGERIISLEEAPDVGAHTSEEVLMVHDALDALAKVDGRKAKIIELRFFGGLNIEETAECLSVSAGTVMRDWTLAKAWLKRQISDSAPPVRPER